MVLRCGVVPINYKIDMVEVKDNLLIHKQIEKKDGFTYMRMKKRPIVRVS